MFDTRSLLHPSQTAEHMAALFSDFGGAPEDIPQCESITTAATPEPFRGLLAHEGHMTVTLEDYYESPVNLTVLQVVRNGNHYTRKILLSSAKSGQVVQYGIIRFNFEHCSQAVQDKIVEGKTPLGRILIEHDVLRRISTHALLNITPNREMMEAFGLAEPVDVYGRFATIFCNGEPAVDLLEVVTPKNED